MTNTELIEKARRAVHAAKRKKHGFTILQEVTDALELATSTGPAEKNYPLVHFANELDNLGLNAVVLTYDDLAWQAHSSTKGFLYWIHAGGDADLDMTSVELRRTNEGQPFRVIFTED